MKNARHLEIMKLIREYDIETQTELVSRLSEAGFVATQATVSRDIRALKLIKTQRKNGKACYEVPDSTAQPEKYIRLLKEAVVSVIAAKNLIVVRTVPGMAMAAAAALDEWENEDIAGCIAGDDTIFCAVYPDADPDAVISKLNDLLSY